MTIGAEVNIAERITGVEYNASTPVVSLFLVFSLGLLVIS